MKILAVSDIETSFIYSPAVADRFAGVRLVISCGDLQSEYLDYIHSMLEVPFFFVRGNHDLQPPGEGRYSGGINLHHRLYREGNLLLAGMEGSLLYSDEGPQYTQAGMWMGVFMLVPALLKARLQTGRFLDIFVSHTPPWRIHDIPDDPPHHGFKAFRWLIRVFQPALHIHGHVHVFHPALARESLVDRTRVINAYGYQEIEF